MSVDVSGLQRSNIRLQRHRQGVNEVEGAERVVVVGCFRRERDHDSPAPLKDVALQCEMGNQSVPAYDVHTTMQNTSCMPVNLAETSLLPPIRLCVAQRRDCGVRSRGNKLDLRYPHSHIHEANDKIVERKRIHQSREPAELEMTPRCNASDRGPEDDRYEPMLHSISLV